MIESLQLRARQARAEIRSGALRGSALLDLLLSVPFLERDAWIDEVLGMAGPPPPDEALPRGSVPYLPSGVEEIIATVREVPVGVDDHFVDLGSGLGRVVILAQLLTGAQASGIEIQAQLVHDARARAAELALSRVSFVHANAADLELDGSVFFLYAPFNGSMMTDVLRRLETVARRRRIIISAVGPDFRDVPWLRSRKTSSVSLTIYEST